MNQRKVDSSYTDCHNFNCFYEQKLFFFFNFELQANSHSYSRRPPRFTSGAQMNIQCVITEPAEFIDTPSEVTAALGRSITLSCKVKGDPEPSLVWAKDSEEIFGEILGHLSPLSVTNDSIIILHISDPPSFEYSIEIVD